MCNFNLHDSACNTCSCSVAVKFDINVILSNVRICLVGAYRPFLKSKNKTKSQGWRNHIIVNTVQNKTKTCTPRNRPTLTTYIYVHAQMHISFAIACARYIYSSHTHTHTHTHTLLIRGTAWRDEFWEITLLLKGSEGAMVGVTLILY